jgi:hypothetical protein
MKPVDHRSAAASATCPTRRLIASKVGKARLDSSGFAATALHGSSTRRGRPWRGLAGPDTGGSSISVSSASAFMANFRWITGQLTLTRNPRRLRRSAAVLA